MSRRAERDLVGIDHFTVVCLVTWPLDGSEARVDLVLIQTSLLLLCKTSCSDVNKVHLHDKSREVCIKTRSTLASLPSTGQVAEQTTVKWSIRALFTSYHLMRHFTH